MTNSFPFPFFGQRPQQESAEERRSYLLRFESPPLEGQREALARAAVGRLFGTPVSDHRLFLTDTNWAAWVVDIDRTWTPGSERGYYPDNDQLAIVALTETLREWHDSTPIEEVLFLGALSDAGSEWDEWSAAEYGRPSEFAGLRVRGMLGLRRDGDAWMNQDAAYDARVRELEPVEARLDERYVRVASEALAQRLAESDALELVDESGVPDERVRFSTSWDLSGEGTLSIAGRVLRLRDAEDLEQAAEPCSGSQGLLLGAALLIPGEARTDVAVVSPGRLAFIAPIPGRVTAASAPNLVEIDGRWYRALQLTDSTTSAPTLTRVSRLPEETVSVDQPPSDLLLEADSRYVATLPSGHRVASTGKRLIFFEPGSSAGRSIKRKKARKSDIETLVAKHPFAHRAMVEIGDGYGLLYEADVEQLRYRPLFHKPGVRARYLGADRIVALGPDHKLVLYAHDPAQNIQLQRLDERPFLGGWFDVRRGKVLTVERAKRSLQVFVLEGRGDRFIEETRAASVEGPSHLSKVVEIDGGAYVKMKRDTFALRW